MTLLWVLKKQGNHQRVAQKSLTPQGIEEIHSQGNSHIAPEIQSWPFLSAVGCKAELHIAPERLHPVWHWALCLEPSQGISLTAGLPYCTQVDSSCAIAKLVLCWVAIACLLHLGSSFWRARGGWGWIFWALGSVTILSFILDWFPARWCDTSLGWGKGKSKCHLPIPLWMSLVEAGPTWGPKSPTTCTLPPRAQGLQRSLFISQIVHKKGSLRSHINIRDKVCIC